MADRSDLRGGSLGRSAACVHHLTGIISGSGSPDPAGAARRLVDVFGTLPDVMDASPRRLHAALAGDLPAVAACARFRRAMQHTLRQRVRDRPVLANYAALYDYLRTSMAALTYEQMRVLFLTGTHALIAEEVVALGSLSEATVFGREIVHRALDCGAASMILAHNHPSGDPKPSPSDLRVTRRLSELARSLDLCLIDHIIVGRKSCLSMRSHAPL